MKYLNRTAFNKKCTLDSVMYARILYRHFIKLICVDKVGLRHCSEGALNKSLLPPAHPTSCQSHVPSKSKNCALRLSPYTVLAPNWREKPTKGLAKSRMCKKKKKESWSMRRGRGGSFPMCRDPQPSAHNVAWNPPLDPDSPSLDKQ
jgi:hypothetical protein